jgi:integrase
MPPDKKHLRMSGRQWQYRRKLPRAVAERMGKTWLIINLGTDSLIEARRQRDRINSDLGDTEAAIRTSESEQLADYQSAPDRVRKMLEYIYEDQADKAWEDADKRDDEKGKQDAIDRYKRVTGQLIPIEMNLAAWQQQAPVVETSQKAREASLSRFMKTSDARSVSEVDRRVAGRYVDALVAEGLADKTVNSHVTHMSSYWRFLVKKGICDVNPWRDQGTPGKMKQQRLAWTREEVAVLLDRANTKLMLHCIFVAALMGMRAGELADLTAADCSGGLCRVAQRGGKSASAERTIPWHPQLKTLVAQRLEGKDPDEFLFHEFKGSGKSVSKLFTRFRDKVFPDLRVKGEQSPKTFHSFRHYWITERIRAGCPPHLVRACAGHKQQGITLGVYFHGITEEQAREIVEAVQL